MPLGLSFIDKGLQFWIQLGRREDNPCVRFEYQTSLLRGLLATTNDDDFSARRADEHREAFHGFSPYAAILPERLRQSARASAIGSR